jgi:hypothetical protein
MTRAAKIVHFAGWLIFLSVAAVLGLIFLMLANFSGQWEDGDRRPLADKAFMVGVSPGPRPWIST